MRRLLDFHRRLYWLVDGWSMRFRVIEVDESAMRPRGVKYSFTLHDVDGTRLLGFGNAHAVARSQAYDQEGLAFEFDTEAVELETELEDDDDATITD